MIQPGMSPTGARPASMPLHATMLSFLTTDAKIDARTLRTCLREAVAALETIRLGLLYMQAGTGTVESLTMELEAARGISDDMENLLAGHREVERILQERRKTGVFTLVTDPGWLKDAIVDSF
jgi:hypothetical protein